MSEQTVESLLKSILTVEDGKEAFVVKSKSWIKERIKRYIENNQDVSAKQFVPLEVQTTVLTYLPKLSEKMIEKAKSYVESADGQEKMVAMASNFCLQKESSAECYQCFYQVKKLLICFIQRLLSFLTMKKRKICCMGYSLENGTSC